jgi:hypothetical protein
MKLEIKRQDKYSRGQLLLRTFFGWLYIGIPHFFLLFFVSIGAAVLSFFAWFAVLFTGKYPKAWFEFVVKCSNWGMRVCASMFNLVDGYPAFGLGGPTDNVAVEVEYPDKLSRGKLILRLFLGMFYILIPHGFCLYFRFIASGVLMFLAWFVQLFAGKYPESWHHFNVGTLRWMMRVGIYYSYMTDTYPPFSGKE